MNKWVVYFNSTDFPDAYVARLFVGDFKTSNYIYSTTYDVIEDILSNEFKLSKNAKIGNTTFFVEVWITV